MIRKAHNGTKRKARASLHPSHERLAQNPRRVESLQNFLKAYGRGSSGMKLREQFAKRTNTSLAYLVHLAYGYRVAGEKLAMDIEQHSHGLVPVEDLRPDVDWSYLRAARRGAQSKRASA